MVQFPSDELKPVVEGFSSYAISRVVRDGPRGSRWPRRHLAATEGLEEDRAELCRARRLPRAARPDRRRASLATRRRRGVGEGAPSVAPGATAKGEQRWLRS